MTVKPQTIEAPVNVVAPGEGGAAPAEAPPVETIHVEVPAAVTAAKAVAESAFTIHPDRSKRRRRRRPFGGIIADPHWTMRRRTIGLTLLSCLGLSIYAISQGEAMAAVVLPSTAGLAAACVGVYTLGGSWERIGGVPDGNIDVDLDVDIRRGE